MDDHIRKYLILDNKYRQGKSKEKGHCRLDKKTNKIELNITIENFGQNSIYDIIVLEDINKKKIGRIFTDLKGRGEILLSLDNRDYDLTLLDGLAIEKDNVFIIGNNFGNKKVLDKYLQANKEGPPQALEEAQESEEETKEEIKVEKEEAEETEETEEDEEAEEEKEEVDDTQDDKEEIIEEILEEKEPSGQEVLKEEKDEMYAYVSSVLKYFPQVEPTKIPLHGYSWWKIDDSQANKGFLPYYNYLMGGNIRYKHIGNATTSRYLINKYGYYLFGIYREQTVKYYIYGVPGQFLINEHPYMGLTGYNTWFEGKGGYGYWLIYIDPITTTPIYTINPMQPNY